MHLSSASPLARVEYTLETGAERHLPYVAEICELIETSARARGTGIAKRDRRYVEQKLIDGHAVIAFAENALAGFCYIETWTHGKYVANSGLIVAPQFRQSGLAKRIKRRIFELSRELYPNARIFGITTSLAVMKINTELGYHPVTFSELSQDDEFWSGCQACPNFDVLTRMQRRMCLCTGMMYDPRDPKRTSLLESALGLKAPKPSEPQP